jgi:hypothetical protein
VKKKQKVIIEKRWPSRDALKKAIRKFLDKKPADQLDIATAMRIDLRLACQAIDELVADGKIEPVKSAAAWSGASETRRRTSTTKDLRRRRARSI